MALHSVLRRSSSSTIALLVIKSARTSGGAISAVEKQQNVDELHRRSSVSSLRFSTASAGKKRRSAEDSLIRIIDSEIKCAMNSDLHDCAMDIPEGFPFNIHDKPGGRNLVLTREYRDEIIKVEVEMPTTQNNAEVGTDDTKTECSVPLMAIVSKGNEFHLLFDAKASPNQISILRLSMQSLKNPIAYRRYDFSDLNKGLQEGLQQYLETRGLEPSTANFLLEYMISKDSKEYLWWLKNLRKFVWR